jgi:SfnB family sulfur acquisition oxidoreductase
MSIQAIDYGARDSNVAPPPSTPHVHRIQSDLEAIQIAQDLAKKFAEEASDRDRLRRLPVVEIDEFSNSGLWAISVPREFGGAEVSRLTLIEVFRTVAEVDSSLGQIPHNHFCVVDAIRLDGTPEQKRYFFSEVLNGKRLGNAFSEAGSRTVQEFQTKIAPDGDQFIINGRKFYSTGALFAHWVPVSAVNEEKQALLVLIPRSTPGLTIVDDWSSFGQRTTASGTVTLENVRVRPEWIIPGYKAYERPTLTGPLSQIIQAAIDAGIAHAALRETIQFIRTRSRPWIDSKVEHASEDTLTIAEIGDLEIKLHAADALLERAASILDQGEQQLDEQTAAAGSIAVAEAKALTTEIAIAATNKLFELAGTQSTLAKYNLDLHWRNARVHTLHDPVRWKYFHVGNYYLNDVHPPRHPWN